MVARTTRFFMAPQLVLPAAPRSTPRTGHARTGSARGRSCRSAAPVGSRRTERSRARRSQRASPAPRTGRARAAGRGPPAGGQHGGSEYHPHGKDQLCVASHRLGWRSVGARSARRPRSRTPFGVCVPDAAAATTLSVSRGHRLVSGGTVWFWFNQAPPTGTGGVSSRMTSVPAADHGGAPPIRGARIDLRSPDPGPTAIVASRCGATTSRGASDWRSPC